MTASMQSIAESVHLRWSIYCRDFTQTLVKIRQFALETRLSTEMLQEESTKSADAMALQSCIVKVSPLDNSNRSGAVWQDALVGGVKKYTEGNWRKADNKSVFKDAKTTADSRNKAELIKRSVSFENDIEEVEDEEFEVEKVLKKRMHPVLGVQYKVNWTGHSHIYNKWMSEGDLKHCSEVIAVFEALVKEKGVLKKDATDKEADSFYYQRRHIKETEPTSTETH